MYLRIRTAAGIQTITEDRVVVTLNNQNKITDVVYGYTPTIVSAIPAFDGTNTKYEFGKLNNAGGLDVVFTN